jgi:hypothetical protein
VAEGRWVAHPPGYALFVMLGRLFHACGFAPYLSVQLSSVSLSVAGLFALYRLMRQVVDPFPARALTAAAAFSWLTLLNVQTGTSHASDLFTVSLLLLSAVKLPASRANAWGPDLLFAVSLFLCAGFRLARLVCWWHGATKRAHLFGFAAFRLSLPWFCGNSGSSSRAAGLRPTLRRRRP